MTGANVAMAEYWAGIGGQRWLRRHALLERQLADVGDRLLQVAAPRTGENVLEVGCGTGMLARRIANAAAPGRLVAVDISEPLLEVARARVAGVEFRLADAQSDALPVGHDLAVSRFGVMFFAGPEAAFANIRAGLRTGGRLCFVCWAPYEESPNWSVPMAAALRHLDPPEPVPPGTPGPFSLADTTVLRGILEAAGFADIAVRTEAVPTRQPTLEEWVALAVAMGPAGALITAREPDPAVVAAIRDEVTRDLAAFLTQGGGVAVPALVHFVTAINPG